MCINPNAIPYLTVCTKAPDICNVKVKSYETIMESFNKRKANKEYRKELRRCKKLKKNGEITEFSITRYY